MSTPLYVLPVILLLGCIDGPSSGDVVKVADPRAPQNTEALRDEGLLEPPDSSYVSYWCSIEILAKTESAIGRLTLVEVADFLATLHPGCNANVEFSEWSNDLLFKVVSERPDRFIELMGKNSSLYRAHILDQLESPVHDNIDHFEIMQSIEDLDYPYPYDVWKDKVLASLIIAKNKGT